MSDSFTDVEKRARKLSADERARLAELLLESLRGTTLTDIESAWSAEIAERVAAFDRGELDTHLAEDVFAEARRTSK